MENYKTRSLFFGLLVLFFSYFSIISVNALYNFRQGSVVRDVEFESFIKKITKPIFKVAGLEHKNLKVFLIVDNNVNAFVTVGDRMYIHSGLIEKFPKVSNLIGVLAHEIGHIAGGHVSKTYWRSKQMGRYSLAMAAAGFLTAIVNPEAGIFMMMGGAGSAANAYLHYSRIQESSADQAAMEYLTKLGWGVDGLYEVMDYFKQQEYFTVSMQDTYLRTHPIGDDRVRAIKGFKELQNKVESVNKRKSLMPSDWSRQYDIIRAKVSAYTANPMHTLRKYKYNVNGDNDVATIYANAIANLRIGRLDESEKYVDLMIKKTRSSNPFALELKSIILLNRGKIEESAKYLRQAMNILPNNDLFRVDYAAILLRSSDKNKANEALRYLEMVEDSPIKRGYMYWHYRAIAHGRLQQMDLMALSLAEKAMIAGDLETARKQCYRAKIYAKKEATTMASINDILQEIKTIEDEESYFF